MVSNTIKVTLLVAVLLCLAAGCSRGHGGSPVSPPGDQNILQTPSHVHREYNGHRLLLGLWDVTYDFSTREFVPAPMRAAEMHANVVSMLNGNPGNLKVVVTDDSQGMTEGIFELNVTIIHPLQNSIYRGFDVKGIVLGKGASTLSAKDDPDLMWMNPNTGLRLLNYDGWTRWWNPSEFGDPGLFGYTPGLFGTPGFTTSATLNPYKYFSSALDFDDPVDKAANLTSRGNFSTSKSTGETRRYVIQFPMVGGVPSLNYQYAVDASWEPPTGGGSVPDFTDFPPEANCPEPFYIKVDQSQSDVFFFTNENRGGNLSLDIEVFDWGAKTGGIADQISSITLQSSTLFSTVESVPVTNPDPGTDWSGKYHFELMDVTPSSDKNQEVLITIESAEGSYAPPGGVQEHPKEPLAAYALVNIETRGPMSEGQGQLAGLLNPIDVKTPETGGGLEGDTSYVVDDNGLQVFNVANTQSPVQVVQNFGLEGAPKALEVSNDTNYAYAITGNAGMEFRVVDVGDLSNPTLITTGVSTDDTATALDVSEDAGGDQAAFVGDAGGQVKIIDLTTPTNPQEVGHFDVAGGATINDVVQSDGVAYVACNTFQIWNVSIPGSIPPVVKSLNLGSSVTAAVYDDSGYVIAGDASGKIHVINVKIPASASVVSTYTAAAKINDLELRQNLLFASVDLHPVQILFFNEGSQTLELLAENAGVADPNKMCLSGHNSYVIDDAVGEIDISEYLPVNQPNYIGWGQTFGGTLSEAPYGIACGYNGEVYVGGAFGGTIDLDPGPGTDEYTSNGSSNAFISKYDSEGNYKWGIAFGSAETTIISGVAVDPFGNVVACGYFSGTVDFDPEGSGYLKTALAGGPDCFLVVYEPDLTDMTFKAARTWGGNSPDGAYDVAVDSVGNIYTVGYFQWQADFNPEGGDTRTCNRNGSFVCKYDSNMNYQWAKTWSTTSIYTPNDVFAIGVAVDENGSAVYITGYLSGTAACDLDPTGGDYYVIGHGSSDGYLISLSSNGDTFNWARYWGGIDEDAGMGVTCDHDGNILNNDNVFVTGIFIGTSNFNPAGTEERTSLGGYDGFLSKFNSSGSFNWVKHMGNTPSSAPALWPNYVCCGGGNVYVAGYFYGTGDFDVDATEDQTIEALGQNDAFITSFSSGGGACNWTRTYGWVGADSMNAAVVGPDGYVYLTGYFSGLIDINPGDVYDFRQGGDTDVFLSRILSNGYWE